jgi:hypothetical protein
MDEMRWLMGFTKIAGPAVWEVPVGPPPAEGPAAVPPQPLGRGMARADKRFNFERNSGCRFAADTATSDYQLYF